MPKRKHTDETIFEVRRLLAAGTAQSSIQAQTGVPQPTISKINTFRLVPVAEMPLAIPTALELFHMGNDYIAIGQFLHISEAEVERRMGLKRAKRLGEVGARGGGTDSSPRIGTPAAFRNLLISIARSAQPVRALEAAE
ncbi:hypothetical protein [Rhizobium mesoamericanum]|uniref:Uncharacterized protein n=1 Tax=Rhizobium mesoamericanum STM3625 TaxID=1211777 RepID=K0PZX2_9HYPH|nr:hypothetical protein [Rhizobium mesoamericanum]CCM77107.1 hypothetical protein BN77_4155 [Rhizobium mesoamericanum STM3625]